MKQYKEIRVCGLCKQRFVVQDKSYYCPACTIRIGKANDKEREQGQD